MLAGGGGSIIHTSSIHATMAEQGGNTGYTSTKAGLNGLMRAIAVQYGKQGIRSNSIAPGLTLSEFVKSHTDERTLAVWMDYIMAPAPAEPEDQAAVVVFLASDESRFINGQVLTVDGGLDAFTPPMPALTRMRGRASIVATPGDKS
jgi:NAD(P)-dependent dehydrogenase (short-subunit alcohol dehydrogenase family)